MDQTVLLDPSARRAEAALQDAVAIVTTVEIRRRPEEVFSFVTTPAQWHLWHPATHSVRDVPDRPLVTGETMLESISAAGRRFDALWTVLACDAPRTWAIAAETRQGAAHITYTLSPRGTGCSFERRLLYRSSHAPWRWLDSNFTRWLLQRQSQQALANLKRVMEAG
jgi:uncharacterized protein YndB with AHSA1/START domain